MNGMEHQEIIGLQQEGHYDPGDERKITTGDAENPRTIESDYDDDEDVEIMLPSSNLPDDAKVQNNAKYNLPIFHLPLMLEFNKT